MRSLTLFWLQGFIHPPLTPLSPFSPNPLAPFALQLTDPCGSNMFAAWENKLHVLVCGGIPGIEIKTVDLVVLSIGIEVPNGRMSNTVATPTSTPKP